MIYFDNAATTFPKPSCVIDEVRKCMLTYCGNPGRGAHTLSLKAAQKVFECRESAAQMFGAADSDRVVFTPNTTYALNVAIKGLLRTGDHVLISDMEHNSVWRPIHKMASEGKIEYDIFETLTEDGCIDTTRLCRSVQALMRKNTRAVICTHMSNICSAKLPIAALGELCRREGILFIVDGAQSAGHAEIDVEKIGISALCLPGHKGLYGPQGSGMLVWGEGVSSETFVEGGNGVDSLSAYMSEQTPERYEAGTVATPCIAGLCEGLRFVREQGVESIACGEARLFCRARELLCNTAGVKVHAPRFVGSTLLFSVDGIPSERLAEALSDKGVCVRGGYHCAPLAHKTLGTPDDGAVRISFGAFNTLSEVERFYKLLREIIE